MILHFTENLVPVTNKPDLSNLKSIEISKLFGRESWRLLHLCRIEGKSFLEKPAASWDDCSDYKMLEKIVEKFVVVNDMTLLIEQYC